MRPRITLLPAVIAVLTAFPFPCGPVARAAEDERVHCSIIEDQDGDEVVLLESEWISMHLMPFMQATINRFVFRPTGNDICEMITPKIRARGGGILQDCLWEQDWRFQELAHKSYPFKITKVGPDEGQVVFETDIAGWVGAANSGVISKLLSNLTLRRTVTLRSGQPFFRFDFEFLTKDGMAKRPTFWAHNSCCVNPGKPESVLRPSARAIMEMCAPWGGALDLRTHYIYDFNHGWSARIARTRKEGIVYLMDYDYIQMLYNNGTTTEEWTYDSILALKDMPWKGRVYILPIIGLSGVDYANEYFICELKPRRKEGKLRLDFVVTSSYEPASRVTFNTEVEYQLLPERGETKATRKMAPVTIDGLSFQPATGTTEEALDALDPLVFNINAFVELPDGNTRKFHFQHYYAGEYDSGQGINTQRSGKPVRLLDQPVRKPRVPTPPEDVAIDRENLRIFGVLGFGSEWMGVRSAVEAIPNAKLDVGYCSGRDAYGYALGDFPYDYERLFGYRAMILANAQVKEMRSIGASILLPWLQRGGGLVLTGGESAFDYELREHEINRYFPIEPAPQNLVKDPQQLQPPLAADHPIFRDVDLSQLPWLHYCHNVKLKEGCGAKVLMQVGQRPFIVEHRVGDQITMVVTCNQFDLSQDFPDKPHLRKWNQWPKLLGNIVRYAAGDLK